MSKNEITHVHELLAKYNVILDFAQRTLNPQLDKPMTDSIDAIMSEFVAYRDAIVDFANKIDSAIVQLKRHVCWGGFEATCETYEKKAESDMVKDILAKLGL